MAKVAIIGLGAWGLCALERLIDAARGCPGAPLEVHIIEPSRPGGGLYSQNGPDYLVLNTPCGQHNLHPYPERLVGPAAGRGLYDWAVSRGYRWQGYECRVSTTGRPISPHDFLPRRLMGEYLEWFYETLVLEAPLNVTVTHHRSLAIDVEPLAGACERVHLGGGDFIDVDHVILTPGHTECASKGAELDRLALAPYPVDTYLGDVAPGEQVAIEGMGLVAMDVVAAFTLGLGGGYEQVGDGKLRYIASGREPALYLFSRSGYPYCAKSVGTEDPVGKFEPAICTPQAVAALRGRGRPIDARRELLPLVLAEMELVYFRKSAELLQGPVAARNVHEALVAAWGVGMFATAKRACGEVYGHFDAFRHIFPGEGLTFASAADYQASVYSSIEADVKEALVEGGGSPVKAALETLRALRDVLRSAIEFKGLSAESWLDFQAHLRGALARPVTGPPVFRNQQLLALMDAGVVRLAFGPCPEVVPAGDGSVVVRSSVLEQHAEMKFKRLVRAHVETPAIGRSSSGLLANLARRGRVRPMSFDGVPAGSIDMTSEFHPVGDLGVEERLWVFGAITEGVRYFNLYIPSPKSRVRAFVDAELCARSILGDRQDKAGQGEVAEELWSGGPGPGATELVNGLRAPERAAEPERVLVLPSMADPGPVPSYRLRIALVNNMPDAAFEETESRWRQLLCEQAGFEIELTCFALPGIERGSVTNDIIAERYRDLSELFDRGADALVVTGAEPKKAELTDEPYWPALQQLLSWGRQNAGHMLLSCLTSHCALWAFDGLPRRLLPDKCSGVFRQVVNGSHPLAAGLCDVALPHSRFNEVPTSDLVGAGYQVVLTNESGAWTAATAQRDGCSLVLLQGHPEYTLHTLLREYRRDVRRYLQGAQGSYPRLPVGYLDADGAALLEQYRGVAECEPRDPTKAIAFPFGVAASHVRANWEPEARAFMRNWLRQVAGVLKTAGQPAARVPLARGEAEGRVA